MRAFLRWPIRFLRDSRWNNSLRTSQREMSKQDHPRSLSSLKWSKACVSTIFPPHPNRVSLSQPHILWRTSRHHQICPQRILLSIMWAVEFEWTVERARRKLCPPGYRGLYLKCTAAWGCVWENSWFWYRDSALEGCHCLRRWCKLRRPSGQVPPETICSCHRLHDSECWYTLHRSWEVRICVTHPNLQSILVASSLIGSSLEIILITTAGISFSLAHSSSMAGWCRWGMQKACCW